MGSGGQKPHYVRGFRQRRNASHPGSEHRYHRREPPRFQVLRESYVETFEQVALVVQESEAKLRLLEQEETDGGAGHREVDKGKSRML